MPPDAALTTAVIDDAAGPVPVTPRRHATRRRALAIGMAFAACAAATCAAWAQPPQRNMLVEIRLIDEADSHTAGDADPASATGVSISSRRSAEGTLPPQSLRMLNGSRGTMRFTTALPFQWLQSAGADSSSRSASAGGGAGYIQYTQAITWLQAGHGLVVKPRWPGGRAEAVVDIEVDVSRVDAPVGSEIPASSREAASTTISTALGRWTTFAASGGPEAGDGHTWSSASGPATRRRLFQIKVQAL